jgi:transcriptional regulator
MYVPPAFREDRSDILRAAIEAHPLGTLITRGSSGLRANVLPFTFIDGADGHRLHAHLAKANEQVSDLREGCEALVLFQGPQAYVSPSWYPTKQLHGKAVPTWNYVIVEVRGTPSIKDDPQWLLDQITGLTDRHEAGRAEPWRVTDAPPSYVEAQLRGIVGLDLSVDHMAGTWKLSQNQPAANRQGVVDGLQADGADALARLVAEAGLDH